MKKHYIIEGHHSICTTRAKFIEEKNRRFILCNHNHEHVLFYHKGNFYLLSARTCWFEYEKYKIIEDILNESSFKTEVICGFERSNNMNEYFVECRKHGILLENIFKQVNYIYFGGPKMYCIASDITLSDAIEANENLELNYNKTEKYLIENGLRFLLKELKILVYENTIIVPSEKELIKSINNIILEINGNS